MTALRRMHVRWTGTALVGEGVSTFYSASPDPTGWPGAVRSFFAAAPLLFPAGVTIQVPNLGDVIESSDGSLLGTWTDGTLPTPFSGGNTGDYPAGVGMQVRWPTNAVVGRRRLEGSTFLVPIASAIFDVDGTIDTATVTGVTTAANALIAPAHMMSIWARPLPARTGKKGPLPARPGESHLIMGVKVPDRVSWLRSRRR